MTEAINTATKWIIIGPWAIFAVVCGWALFPQRSSWTP